MRTTTFQWNGATFEMQSGTVSSGVDALYIANNLFPGARTNREWRHDLEYGNFLSTVHITSGNPGFTLPSLDDSLDAIRAFYKPFLELPTTFFNAVHATQIELGAPINDHDLAPEIDPNAQASANTDESGATNSPPSTELLSESFALASD